MGAFHYRRRCDGSLARSDDRQLMRAGDREPVERGRIGWLLLGTNQCCCLQGCHALPPAEPAGRVDSCAFLPYSM